MNRDEAKNLLGKFVHTWTALNGEYVGILREVVTEFRKPWRGNVEILAVTSYPPSGLGSGGRGGFRNRKPFAKGEIKNFGGINIREWNGRVPPAYEDSIKQALSSEISLTLKTLKNTLSKTIRARSDHLLIMSLEYYFKEWTRLTGEEHSKQQEFQQWMDEEEKKP